MAKLGQTCATCDGTCCRIDLQYAYPATGIEHLGNGEFMKMSIREIRRLGFREFVPEEDKRYERKGYEGQPKRCPSLTEDGRCTKQGKDKPRLCRSYWCGGKWWSPNGQRLTVPACEVIVKGGINERKRADIVTAGAGVTPA